MKLFISITGIKLHELKHTFIWNQPFVTSLNCLFNILRAPCFAPSVPKMQPSSGFGVKLKCSTCMGDCKQRAKCVVFWTSKDFIFYFFQKKPCSHPLVMSQTSWWPHVKMWTVWWRGPSLKWNIRGWFQYLTFCLLFLHFWEGQI